MACDADALIQKALPSEGFLFYNLKMTQDYNSRLDFEISPAKLVARAESSINIILSASLRASHTFKLYASTLNSLGCDAVFLPFETQPQDEARLAELFSAYRGNPAFRTIMVSDPFKQRVERYLDGVTDRATLCGGVNMITKDDAGHVTGDNLDGLAFNAGLTALDGVSLRKKSVLFFGCGGVSSAVSTSLAGQLDKIGLIDPDQVKAQGLKDRLLPLNPNIEIFPAISTRNLSEYSVLYNGSGLGKGATIGQSPLLDEEASAATLFIDAIYTPPVTRFLQQGQQRGANIINGLSHMLGSTTLHCSIIAGRTLNLSDTAAIYRGLQA